MSWQGTFYSTCYSFLWWTFVKGNVEINNLETSSPTYKMTYTGFYRSGQTIEGNVEVDISNNSIYKLAIPSGFGVMNGIQLQQYITIVVNERTENTIKGNYHSYSPADSGVIEVKRY